MESRGGRGCLSPPYFLRTRGAWVGEWIEIIGTEKSIYKVEQLFDSVRLSAEKVPTMLRMWQTRTRFGRGLWMVHSGQKARWLVSGRHAERL
jgi:hypothetical protein